MLPPEVLRIVLLIGLAATGYMMILAWNDDRQQTKAPVQYADDPIVADLAAPVPGVVTPNPVPGATDSPTGSHSDVPDASLLSDAPIAVEAPTLSVANSARLVRVNTRALSVWIDLEGGDLVRVRLKGFPVELDQPDVPYQLLERSSSRVYTAQSGLIGTDGPDSASRPLFATSRELYELNEAPGEVVLTTNFKGNAVRKIFSFQPDDHLLGVRYEMENASSQPLQAAMFAQIKRDDRPPSTDESFSLAPQPYLGAAITTPEERYLKVDFEDIDEEGLDERVEGGWVAFLQHYFLSAWISPEGQPNRFYGRKGSDGRYLFGYTGPLTTVAPGATGVWESQFYAGPKDQKRLEEIAENLNLTIDYGFLWWVAIPLFSLLDWMHDLVGNWGIAIILLTIVVKAVLYPLSAAGYKSMANMRRVAPQLKKIQERYANDREKLSKEMMALYKKEGANPLGGCLPMLLPMPIFIALYWVLFESVELRQAPFMLWIDDLAQMDPYFILPLLMGASTYMMQSLNPQVGDPMQQKMMKMMPIMFTVLFLFFPAGLVLYWLVNNLLSIAQQQYVYRQAEKAQQA
ncbi:MAG: membrane protein insertase YidC [Pseudomonadales bacterium]|nr:membrane protein insertase YidC [Pseudomonadales bacterium]